MGKEINWRHTDKWITDGKGFRVEVARWFRPGLPDYFIEDVHTWNVYTYIYPGHRLFDTFDVDGGMWQDACNNLCLHGGPSFFQVHRNTEGHVTAIQVGCDYNHYGDDYYTQCATKEEAWSVFDDAEALYKKLAGAVDEVAP